MINPKKLRQLPPSGTDPKRTNRIGPNYGYDAQQVLWGQSNCSANVHIWGGIQQLRFCSLWRVTDKPLKQYVVYLPGREPATVILLAEIVAVVKAAKHISRVAIIYVIDLNSILFYIPNIHPRCTSSCQCPLCYRIKDEERIWHMKV